MIRSSHPSLTLRGAAICLVAAGVGGPLFAAPLALPDGAVIIGEQVETSGSMRLPIGPWRDGDIPAQPTEGAIARNAWRLDGAATSTLDILSPLRVQIAASGYKTLYECTTLECGGFDFRFGIDVLPEPQMHVDLGDFRYLSAQRQGKDGPEYLSVIVSKSATQGFVQITEIGPAAAARPELATSTMSAPMPSAIDLPLDDKGRMILDDLVFAPGKATLQGDLSPALALLARWLATNPDATIELVGYTDSQGSVEGNTALSLQRANAVRLALADRAGIAPTRMSARGAGPSDPRADNATPEGRQKNRRVEVIFTPTR